MTHYYYLIAGLPDLSIEDNKLSFSVAEMKETLYGALSESDRKLIDLIYLAYDNQHLLSLLRNKDASIDENGLYSAQELLTIISNAKNQEEADKRYPSYLSNFVSSISMEDENANVLSDRLSSFYYDYAMQCPNEFVSNWFSLNLNLNNVLSALTARKYKLNVASTIVGSNEISNALRTSNSRDFGLAGTLDLLDAILRISEIEDLVEREKKIDLLKWQWLDDASFFQYFGIEKIFSFLIKVQIIERWLQLDKEAGRDMFRNMIHQLKEEVSIPSEFRI